jgi:hypothetical protein
MQAALVLWHAASHWPDLGWGVDGSQLLVLFVYSFTFAVLCAKWRGQLSVQLSIVFLIALLEPGLLFWQDITAVNPDGTFDAEHVARWVHTHGSSVQAFCSCLAAHIHAFMHYSQGR